jgi:hypothetical protein
VGNNQLTGLVVKNCPNLKKLIYSHNRMKKEATIECCPNLTEIEKYKFDDYVIPHEEEEDFSESEKDNEELNETKAKLEETIQKILANPSNYSLDTILKVDNYMLQMVSSDLRQKFIDFLTSLKKKIDEGYETDEEQQEELPPPPSAPPEQPTIPHPTSIIQKITESKELITQLLTNYCLQTTDLLSEYQD